MALWGISTTTETSANKYNLPKHLSDADKHNSPWDVFADTRGWINRRYGSTEQSGLSTSYYDAVIVPVSGLNTTGIASNTTGLGAATPVAIFFEDQNRSNPISIGAGGTTGIATGTTGYVHVVWNELVYATAGAQVLLSQQSGVTATTIVAYAASVTRNVNLFNYVTNVGYTTFTNYNGQVTNRVAFGFTAPTTLTGAGATLSVNWGTALVGTVTDAYGGGAVVKVFTSDIIRNVGGAGTIFSGVGIGTTTLTVKA
jgi:hypothetical protein